MSARLVLLVPEVGPLRIYQSEAPIDVAALLSELQGADGRYVEFKVKEGDRDIGQVGFLIRAEPFKPNDRARKILTKMTGAHLVVQGTAAFCDLPDETVRTILVENG